MVDTVIVAGERDERHRGQQVTAGEGRFADQLLEKIDLSAHVRARYKRIEHTGPAVREVHTVFQLS